MGAVSASMVEPLLQLLKSLHSDVQHEGHCLNINSDSTTCTVHVLYNGTCVNGYLN